MHDIVNWTYPQNIVKNITHKRIEKTENFLFLNGGLQGCASIFNMKLKEYLLSIHDHIWMHDHYMSLIALSFGKLFYDDHALVLYRQHDDNATVHIITNKLSLLWTELVKNKNIPIVYRPSYIETANYFRIFENKLDVCKKKILQDYLSLPYMTFWRRFFAVFFSRFALGNRGHFKLVIKLLLRKDFLK